MVNVYFTKSFDKENIRQLFLRIFKDIRKDDRIAIKVHFGEDGNTRFVSPDLISPIIEEVKKKNLNHFLTDTNTLYRGSRLESKDHLDTANKHGFNNLGTDIIIEDGETIVPIEKKIFKDVKIGKTIADSDKIITISHFKGHMLFGFGGAIKNLGMGCGSRAGKLEMHSKIKPYISSGCIECNTCVDNCPVDAINISEKSISDDCIGCAKCISVCPKNVVSIPWHGATSKEVQERCAEYAYGAVKGKEVFYITFIKNITKDCDCLKDSEIIAEDVGILASTDPVACDKAAYDLLKQTEKKDVFLDQNSVDGTHILEYSQDIGLGSKDYTLITI